MPPAEPFTHSIGKRDPQLRLAKPEQKDGDGPDYRDPRQYQAVETAPKSARLMILCRDGPSHVPAYHLLADLVFDARFAGTFVLMFSTLAVTVQGRNLAPVIHAIARQRAVTITEYDPQAHDAPSDDVPVITGIDVQMGEQGAG
jgi:hypothetical protein